MRSDGEAQALGAHIGVALRCAVEFLRQSQLPNGEFKTLIGIGEQMSDAVPDSSPFVTTFVLHALGHVEGETAQEMSRKALDFLEREMQFGGVWRYYSSLQHKHCRIPPDLDDTACASFALRSAGRAMPDNAWIFRYNRDADGRFLTWIMARHGGPWALRFRFASAVGAIQAKLRRWAAPRPDERPATRKDTVLAADVDPVVNANAILLLGGRNETAAAVRYLIDFVRSGPHEPFSLYYRDVLALYYMIARAYRTSAPAFDAIREQVVADVLGRQQPDGSFGTVLSTALAASVLQTFAPDAPALAPAVASILRSQRHNGSWPAHPFYSASPIVWGSEELTTAFCVEALTRTRAAPTPRVSATARDANVDVAASAADRPKLAFVYGSRSTIWPLAGKELLAQKGVIRDSLQLCEQIIAERLGWSLVAMLRRTDQIEEHLLEPVMTSMQIALTEEWRERGIVPDAVCGRCGGEFAAGYAKGLLSLEDTIESACRISILVRDVRGRGQMIKVLIPLHEIERARGACPAPFFVVADEPKDTAVICCAVEAASEVRAFLAGRNIEHQMVNSVIGPHTDLIDDWKPLIFEPFGGQPTVVDKMSFYSGDGGSLHHGAFDPDYLWRVVRTPALIGDSMQRMIEDGYGIFVEIAARPTLLEFIQERATALGRHVEAFPTMQFGNPLAPVIDQTEAALRRLRAVRPDHAGGGARLDEVKARFSAKTKFDIFSMAARRNPYPVYEALRRERPVYYDPTHRFWTVSRFADVARILKDDEFFSAKSSSVESTLLGADGEAHARVRRGIAKLFTPAMIAPLQDKIQALAADLAKLIASRGECELMADFARPFPLKVIAWLLDLDMARQDDYVRWSLAIVNSENFGMEWEMQAATKECWEFMADHMARARRKPVGEFMKQLAAVDLDLSFEQWADIGQLFLVAGVVTTVSLLGNAAVILSGDRGLQQTVRSNHRLIEPFVEEVLRYDTPVQTVSRKVVRPVEIAGVPLPPGAQIQVLIGSANRDSDQFPDADCFRLDRDSNHIAFGAGAHFCLGVWLARLEAKVALTELFRILPAMVRADPDEVLEFDSAVIRGPRRLRLLFPTDI